MKSKYKRRYNYCLKLSDRQLEEISAVHIINTFMTLYNKKLEDLPLINPEYIKVKRWKKVTLRKDMINSLQVKGEYNDGRIKIRKTKKGYVFEYSFNWRSKGIEKEKVICGYCKKSDKVNEFGICEKCEKKLKKERKYKKFLYGEL